MSEIISMEWLSANWDSAVLIFGLGAVLGYIAAQLGPRIGGPNNPPDGD